MGDDLPEQDVGQFPERPQGFYIRTFEDL
jgi:hypothetical protein